MDGVSRYSGHSDQGATEVICNNATGDALEVADNGDSRDGVTLGTPDGWWRHEGWIRLRWIIGCGHYLDPAIPPPTTATRVEWIKEATIVVAPFTIILSWSSPFSPK